MERPVGTYDKGGYQVAQSLFAIGTGGWFGAGLIRDSRTRFRYRQRTYLSAISEEMGLIYAMCLILICVSCYVMFLNIAMQLHNLFYKMVALGLGTCYIFQVFLTIGGATKFIPSTGVNTSAGKLWRKFSDQYADHVCNYPGTVYFKRRRGRGY